MCESNKPTVTLATVFARTTFQGLCEISENVPEIAVRRLEEARNPKSVNDETHSKCYEQAK